MDPILAVTTHTLAYPEPNDRERIRRVVLARIQTESGVTGWGECITGSIEASAAAVALIEHGLAPVLVGKDPRDPRARWEELRAQCWWYGEGGISSFAISALDSAVWDIAGKLAGLPVYRMLGGRLTDRLPVCASMIWDPGDLEWTTREVEHAMASGFRAIKCGWGRTHSASFGLDPARDLAAVKRVREVVGDDVAFAADVAAIAKWTHEGYQELADSGVIDIVLIDPGRVEGLTGMLLSSQHAARRGVTFVPHSWSSALNTAAALHVFASQPNGRVFELKLRPSPLQHELVAEPFTQHDGYLEVPERPGLGCDVDEDVVRHYSEG